MKKALLIDTCLERAFFAFSVGESIISAVHLPFGLQHSSELLPKLLEEIQRLKIEIIDLDFIACGVGPGSYTGMRVGASVAKTLSFATNVPLVGVSSLSSFVPEELPAEERFLTIVDAKIGGVYVQLGRYLGEGKYHFEEPLVMPIKEIVSFGVNVLVTPNKKRLESLFKEDPLLSDVKWLEVSPDPLVFLQEALERPKSPFELLYMRKTQAELERGL